MALESTGTAARVEQVATARASIAPPAILEAASPAAFPTASPRRIAVAVLTVEPPSAALLKPGTGPGIPAALPAHVRLQCIAAFGRGDGCTWRAGAL